jgi:hypothetical protein
MDEDLMRLKNTLERGRASAEGSAATQWQRQDTGTVA